MSEPSGLDELYTVDISDRFPHKLKTNVSQADLPYWSHDGKWIYFLGREGTSHQYVRVPASGDDATRRSIRCSYRTRSSRPTATCSTSRGF